MTYSQSLRVVLLWTMAACSESGSDSALAAGAYFGDLTVMHSDRTKSVSSNAEIVIDGSGQLEGTLITESPTTVVGDPGAITGTVLSSDAYMIDLDLAFSFDQSGRFTASGFTTFAAGQRSIASTLVTRDASGSVIGMTSIVWQQE
jgi:hypothetical protein